MKYDFDQIIERRDTGSSKWDKNVLKEMFGEENILPFWVADMDFRVADPIIDAIHKRVNHGIFGYSVRQDSYYESIINWTNRRFGWKIEKDWILYTPGVVPAISYTIQGLLKPGDKVLIQEPVYYPFRKCIENNGCHTVVNELKYDGESYEIDFEDFENKAKDPKVKLFILCSPHNPVSRVWKKEELIRLGDICIANDMLILADEIHNDLIFPGNKHFILASLREEFAQNSITCTAPSKTFNLAGIQSSNIIIPNEVIRNKYNEILERNNIGMQNPLSIAAVEAAYNEGEEWLEELLTYLKENIDFIIDYLGKNLPKAKMSIPQGTYLGWIDLRSYEKDGHRLEELIINEGKVALDGGTWFGTSGEGFMRINFACPRILLKEGMERLCKAVNNI